MSGTEIWAVPQATPTGDGGGRISYICFKLGSNCFGLDVRHVREVLDYQEILPLPLAPAFLLGLVDLRGVPVPVLDLRTKFGLPRLEPEQGMRILILELLVDGREVLVGALADRVNELIEVSATEIAPTPGLGLAWKAEAFHGVVHRETGTVLLVELGRIVALEDIRSTQESILRVAGGH